MIPGSINYLQGKEIHKYFVFFELFYSFEERMSVKFEELYIHDSCKVCRITESFST